MGLPEFTAALEREMTQAGVNQSELGRRIKSAPSMINAWLNGNTKEPSLDKVRQIEQALDLPDGRLTRHFGWVPAGEANTDVVAAIEGDERITDGSKDALVLLYNLFRAQAAR